MRLKSLEIKGFKSFADKTVVNFDENITGIVGPNGCGKSNIVDSIRWVIGEQKISHLRSENLESLVFNGSKTRSASGLAEVTLTFENTRNLLPIEFNTVTITRKFYKSGESEYRLNDVQCRLKDIQNLFMDTGISTDSYAIIELGMKAYDVAYQVDTKTIDRYKMASIDLAANNGQKPEAVYLPVPAVYIIGKDGEIKYRFFEEDYKKQAAVKDILSNLVGLR